MEAEYWLKRYNGREDYTKYSNSGIKILIQKKLKAISESANYLLIEYLNVKTSDDEISSNTDIDAK